MAFAPSSTIWLCAVPFDSSYKNQIYFDTPAEQTTYFSVRTKKTFSEYLVVRKTMPDGSFRSSVKVAANIDSLYGCNYMYYRNENHGTRLFYCFITDLIYISEGTTEIVFETDVYQTWRWDVELLESFVVREHSKTDKIGEHIVPEPFNYGDYTYKEVSPTTDEPLSALTQMGYLVGSSVFVDETDSLKPSRGRVHSGVYQGVYFYYFSSTSNLNAFLDLVELEKEDSILFITVLPQFCVKDHIDPIFETVIPMNGYVNSSIAPRWTSLSFSGDVPSSFGSLTPKNKKLFTSQFCQFVVTNQSGGSVEYNIEDFGNDEIVFELHGDISASPSVTAIPTNYKGNNLNVDESISINSFPQCSFHSDTFKLWLAKNQYSLPMAVFGDIGKLLGGVVAFASGAPTLGGGAMLSGATGIMETFNSVFQARRAGNKASVEYPKNNLLTCMSEYRFRYFFKMLKEEYARAIDEYFTMFGYQTNRVKVPNVSSRPYFNYVQTIDVNIADPDFGIPNKDMETLKNMYNNGVTLWKKGATIGNYAVDNSP